jgi:hypothetical protein
MAPRETDKERKRGGDDATLRHKELLHATLIYKHKLSPNKSESEPRELNCGIGWVYELFLTFTIALIIDSPEIDVRDS